MPALSACAAEIAAGQADKAGTRFATPALASPAKDPGWSPTGGSAAARTVFWADCDASTLGVNVFNDRLAFGASAPHVLDMALDQVRGPAGDAVDRMDSEIQDRIRERVQASKRSLATGTLFAVFPLVVLLGLPSLL